MRDALLSLGPELNDLLGSCAVRLLDLEGASLEAAALVADPRSVGASGAPVEEAVTVTELREAGTAKRSARGGPGKPHLPRSWPAW